MQIYVASPLGFSVPTRHFYVHELLPVLWAAGIEAADPWADDESITAALAIVDPDARRGALREANQAIGNRNERLIAGSAGVFAVLDGPDVDSGTSAEIGWAAAKGAADRRLAERSPKQR